MKTKTKSTILMSVVPIIVLSGAINITLTAFDYVGDAGAKLGEATTRYMMGEVSTFNLEVPRKEKIEEPSMKEWVLKEVNNAGLDPNAIECLIQNESGWDNWRYNINSNGTTDMGLWQINSIHDISVECRWNYKCSTYWAIQKILNDGNMNAWYGYKNCY